MDIIKHFDRTNTANYILYSLKTKEWTDLINNLSNDIRLCYITNDELHKLCTTSNISASEFLEKYILPDDPTIMSGDFGELLSYFAVIENFGNKGFTLFAPPKWRWKDSKNKAAPGSDAVMFHVANSKKYTAQDFVVSIESKMKAVKSQEHRIQTAIDHAAKDKLSRLAKTIIWLEEKHAKDGAEAQRKIIERFKDPSTYGTFVKHHKAIAIIDKSLETDETSKAITNPHGVVAIIFSINDLKKAYEDSRTNVIKSI